MVRLPEVATDHLADVDLEHPLHGVRSVRPVRESSCQRELLATHGPLIMAATKKRRLTTRRRFTYTIESVLN